MRRTALTAAAALALLIIAAVAAALILFTRPQHVPPPIPPATTSSGAPASAPTATTTEFAWLTKAMADCDQEAAKDADTLRFLVVPLLQSQDDDAIWRARSLNDVGNAILLPSDEAIKGLESQALTISKEPYSFYVRDETSKTVYQWTPSSGVVTFSIPKSQDINSFRIQFEPGDQTSGPNWGNPFTRQRGSCYWVNAIVGNRT